MTTWQPGVTLSEISPQLYFKSTFITDAASKGPGKNVFGDGEGGMGGSSFTADALANENLAYDI